MTAEDAPAAPAPKAAVEHRQRPTSPAFRSFIASGWRERAAGLPDAVPAAAFAALRRRRVGELFPGERLVIPAGAPRRASATTPTTASARTRPSRT